MYLDPGGPSGPQLRNMACQSQCTSLYYATHPACSFGMPLSYGVARHNTGIHIPYMPPQCGIGMWHAQPFVMPGPYSGMEQSRLGCTVLDSGPMVGGVSGMDFETSNLTEIPKELREYLMQNSFTPTEVDEISSTFQIEATVNLYPMSQNDDYIQELQQPELREKFRKFLTRVKSFLMRLDAQRREKARSYEYSQEIKEDLDQQRNNKIKKLIARQHGDDSSTLKPQSEEEYQEQELLVFFIHNGFKTDPSKTIVKKLQLKNVKSFTELSDDAIMLNPEIKSFWKDDLILARNKARKEIESQRRDVSGMDSGTRNNVMQGNNWDKASFVAFIVNFWKLAVENPTANPISAEVAQKVADKYDIETVLEFTKMSQKDVTNELPSEYGYDQLQEQAKKTWSYLHKINDNLKRRGVDHWNLSPATQWEPDDLVTVIRGPHKDMKGRITVIRKILKKPRNQMEYKVLSMDQTTKEWFPAEILSLISSKKDRQEYVVNYLCKMHFLKEMAQEIVEQFNLDNLLQLKGLSDEEIRSSQTPGILEFELIRARNNLKDSWSGSQEEQDYAIMNGDPPHASLARHTNKASPRMPSHHPTRI